MKSAYGIIILSDNNTDNGICHHKFDLYDSTNKYPYHETFEIHLLELKNREQLENEKVIKDKEQLKSLSQRLNFLSAKTEEEYMEAARGNIHLVKALDVIKKIVWMIMKEK